MEENQLRNVQDPVSTNKDQEQSSRLVTEGHPLMNVVVLDNIVQYLEYEELKNFRIVCQRWNQVVKNVFWKLSMIEVSCKEGLSEEESKERALELAEENQKLTDTFESTFPSPAGLPTKEILFKGCINRRTLEYFWKERGSLTLTGVCFLLFRYITKECIDLNRYITPMLTTLNIGNSLQSKFAVSFKMLVNIKYLRLLECEILLDGKIVPRTLDLCTCSVIYEGKLFKSGDPGSRSGQKILINDFVDFSQLKNVLLGDNFWRLDVGSGTKEFESLALRDIDLIGLENSQWKADLVCLRSCIFIGDKMEIRAIAGIETGDFEIESLPKTLEHLSFDIDRWFFFLPQPMICAYPKLTSLTIHIMIKRDFGILDFTNCTSLVDFQLRNSAGMYQMDFNRIKLPNSIKNVKLRNVIPNTDAPWQLDTLVLCKYPFSSVESVLCHFTTTKLVIRFNSKLEREEDLMIIVNHWRNSSIEQLAFGCLGDDDIERYFLFTNKNNNVKEEAIDSDRFKTLSSLNLHKDLLPVMESY